MKLAFLSNTDLRLQPHRVQLMRECQRMGYSVTAICPCSSGKTPFESEGIHYIPIQLERASLNPLLELRTLWQMWRALRRVRPDAVHSFTIKPNLYGTLTASWCGIPVRLCSVTGVGYVFLDGVKYLWFRKLLRAFIVPLYRFALRRATRVVFQNQADADLFEDLGLVPPSMAILIPGSGVDTKRFRSPTVAARRTARAKLQLKPKQVATILVGRLLVDKGIYEYIAAARQVRDRYGDQAVFFLLGQTDPGNIASLDAADILQFQADDTVRLLPKTDRVEATLWAMDIFCLPSYREGMPLSTLEAMGVGLPVITTDVPGCRETVQENQSGLLVPKGNAAMLAKALDRLISHPGLRSEMGKKGRKLAQTQFSLAHVLRLHVALYQKLAPSTYRSPSKVRTPRAA